MAAPRSGRAGPEGPAGGGPGACILLVDDTRRFIDLLRTYLRRVTCRVVAARSGDEALRAGLREGPDLICVDAEVRGEDGSAIVRRIRAEAALREVPVILVAGPRGSGDRRHGGADGWISRPVTQEAFLAEVRRFVPLLERGEERIPVSLRVVVRGRTGETTCYTRDLSLRGAFLKMARPLPVGARLALALHLPGGKPPLALKGEVCRVVEPRPGSHLLAGVGVRFLDLPADAGRILLDFIAERRLR